MRFPLQTTDQLKPLVQGFRKRAGLTQAAMAEKLGITQQSYAQMESNLGSTSVERLYTILRLLNVELSFSPPDHGAVNVKGSHDNAPAGSGKTLHSYTTISRPAKHFQARDSASLAPVAPPTSAEEPAKRPKPRPPQAIKQSDKTKW